MKTLKSLFFSALALVAVAACTDEVDEARYAKLSNVTSDNPSFVADGTGGSVAFNTEGGTVVLDVDCGTDWEAVNDSPDWLEASVNLNVGTLTLVTIQNTVDKEMTATVILQTSASGVRFATINITQNAYGAPTISVESAEWHVPAITGLSTEIAVEASEEWKVESVSEDWVSAVKDGDAISLTVDANTETEERNATVTVSCTDGVSTATAYIKVTQDAYGAPTLSVSASEWHAPAVGSLTTTISVEATEEWTVESVSETWLTAVKNGDTVSLTAEENTGTDERSATITVSCTDGVSTVSANISVTQDAKAYITLDAESVSFTSAGGSATVNAEANYDIACSTEETWFSVTCEDGVITVSATENESEEGREGVVIVACGDGAENVAETQFTVTQAGAEPVGEPMIFKFTTTSSNTEVTLPLAATSDISINCTVDWGDGSSESVTTAAPTHTFAQSGTYEVSINGTVPALNSKSITASKSNPFVAVIQWGNTGLTSLDYAFYNCKKLASLPDDTGDAFAEVTTASYAMYYCSALTSIPSGLLANCPKLTSLSYFFNYCTGLKTLPEDLFANCGAVTDMSYIFDNCTSLTSLPDDIFDGCTEATTFYAAFYKCTSLTSVPSGLFKKNTKVTTFERLFYNCSKLSTVPVGIFDNNMAVTTFQNTFYSCSAYTGESPYTTLSDGTNVHLYERENYTDELNCVVPSGKTCFKSCTKLTDYDAITAAGWN